ncbi:MAG: DUF4012 domain-containing protein, partial [Candidatus Uhrbacteria bacterium]|nr:DUF4012 domain-containing protein [Candidatus Uhrbacteria bacterium]
NHHEPSPERHEPEHQPVHHEPTPTPRHKRPRSIRRLFFAFGVVALVAFLAYAGVGVTRLMDGGITAREALTTAEEAIKDGKITEAHDELEAAAIAIDRAQSGADMLRFAKFIPWLGARYEAGVDVLNAVDKTVDVLVSAIAIVSELQETFSSAESLLGWKDVAGDDSSFASLPAETKTKIFRQLASSLPELRQMQTKLGLAQDDLAAFHDLEIADAFGGIIAPFEEALDDLKKGIDILVPFAAIVPEFAGLEGDRQFLMMFLNDTELRPTGGFLGTYGLMVVRDGDITSMSTGDTYHIDREVQGQADYYVASPDPINTYLEQPVWYFRDATWSPDFEEGAQTAVQLMRQEIAYSGQPVPEIHGVIGITTDFLANLLYILGPITIEDQTFTGGNVAEALEWEVEIDFELDGIPRDQRKELVGVLANEVMDRMLSLPVSSWQTLFDLLTFSFTHKDMAFQSYDDGTQAALNDAGWSGTLDAGAIDTLMVVDANMAALKTDTVVDRTFDYAIVKTSKGFEATVDINYDHYGGFDWKTSRYRTYTRVFVPLGSRLLSSSGSMANDLIRNPSGAEGEVTQLDELGLTSFGAFISIEPGENRTLSFTYLLPPAVSLAIEQGSYTLNVEKQMGARDHELNLDLDFGKDVRTATPGEDESDYGDDAYEQSVTLETDLEFIVRF